MKKSKLMIFSLLSVFTVGISVSSLDATAKDKKTFNVEKSKASAIAKMSLNDFSKEFGKDLSISNSIGLSIDNARKDKDPNRLFLSAVELRYAETYSGKKSKVITSEKLFDEAIDLAKNQKNLASLKTIEKNLNLMGEKDKSSKVAKLVSDTEKALAVSKNKQKATALLVDISIDNSSSYCADLYADDLYVGRVDSGYYRYFSDSAIVGSVKLEAFGCYSNVHWGPRYVSMGSYDSYNWSLGN